MNKLDVKNISKKFYDFVIKYDCDKHKELEVHCSPENKIVPIIRQWYMEDTMYFIFLSNKQYSLKKIEEMLNSRDGTLDLIGKLERTFDYPENYIYKIQELDYLTSDLITLDKLQVIVNRKFEYDDDFKEKDYYNLYVDYKNLDEILLSYYKKVFQ